MFEDEAGFGRINKPRYCWCRKGIRPTVPCHHIREYRYAFGAFEPETGENFFLVSSKCDTVSMNVFTEQLSQKYQNDHILLCCDRASWHMSKTLKNFDNVTIFPLLPYTPEMNPSEQIWRELRTNGFKNEIFSTLDKVVDRLCETICNLSNDTVKSITGRDCILSIF